MYKLRFLVVIVIICFVCLKIGFFCLSCCFKLVVDWILYFKEDLKEYLIFWGVIYLSFDLYDVFIFLG